MAEQTLRVSLKSGLDRKVIVVPPDQTVKRGDILDDAEGRDWTVTKVEKTEVLLRVPLP